MGVSSSFCHRKEVEMLNDLLQWNRARGSDNFVAVAVIEVGRKFERDYLNLCDMFGNGISEIFQIQYF